MKILEKPFKRNEYVNFVEECNKDGKLRIELHDGNAYALCDYEIYKDGRVVDLRGTEEYEAEQARLQKETRIDEINNELAILDQKRIRAVCESENLRADGTTWLDYYNNQIADLRKELSSL